MINTGKYAIIFDLLCNITTSKPNIIHIINILRICKSMKTL